MKLISDYRDNPLGATAMNIVMVAVGGFLLLAGLLTWWIPFIGLFGIVGALTGFVLLIVGLVVPSGRPEPIIVQQPSSAQTILAICPQCKNRIPSDSSFCPRCGTDLRPK